ncbi:hypothetical protein MOR12E_28840 [Methylobacterium oryzae]
MADLGAAKAINLIALLGHNGSSRSYARIRGASTEAGLTGTPGYDSGNLPFRSHQTGYDAAWAAGVTNEQYGALATNHFIRFLTAAQTWRFWRIDITDPLASFIDVGRLYLSSAFQPQSNMSYGLQEGIGDPSRVGITKAGRISSRENPKRRYAELGLDFLSETEARDGLFDIEWAQGVTRDVLLIPDPDAGAYLQKRTIYGRMSQLNPALSTYFGIYEKTLRIEEITR